PACVRQEDGRKPRRDPDAGHADRRADDLHVSEPAVRSDGGLGTAGRAAGGVRAASAGRCAGRARPRPGRRLTPTTEATEHTEKNNLCGLCALRGLSIRFYRQTKFSAWSMLPVPL